ncbi:hypothetical protein PFISCL1PPCAC_21853 [Pristionchus fissidentatus]|uniref:F-box domain-containing protein n=1 Tax=Pristionchus fissidentatus TaxID=1538716 RepID=A0AAV5WE57_9BILA|nr:hypothetical protein PFISCL1PPCAC_21853 [Pristionchus fissidentatus]
MYQNNNIYRIMEYRNQGRLLLTRLSFLFCCIHSFVVICNSKYQHNNIDKLRVFGVRKPAILITLPSRGFLRRLMRNKKVVSVKTPCAGITSTGLFDLWEDLLEGKFDGLSVVVANSVAAEIFELLLLDGEDNSCDGSKSNPIEAVGTNDATAQYEMWFEPTEGKRATIYMSRVLERKYWNVTGRTSIMQMERRNMFPILELPGEVASKIVSMLSPFNQKICLHSLAIDQSQARWSREKTIRRAKIEVRFNNAEISSDRYVSPVLCSFKCVIDRFRDVFDKCEVGELTIELHGARSEQLLRVLIGHCAKIRCKNLRIKSFVPCYSKVFMNESLRALMLNKKAVNINMLCESITPAGMFFLWEDLLDGKFDGVSINVTHWVVVDVFDMLRTDGEKSSWEEYNLRMIEAVGTRNTSKRYQIWCVPKDNLSAVVYMSRVYTGREWTWANYRRVGTVGWSFIELA